MIPAYQRSIPPVRLFQLSISLFFVIAMPFCSEAQTTIRQQNNRAVDGEIAICTIQVKPGKTLAKGQKKSVPAITESHQVMPDQTGAFDLVPNILPMQKVPLEIAYPQGRSGEKVIIEVLDGGTLENNKKVKVLTLNSQKKISFNFQVARDPGIYRLTLRKGDDIKEVQLWVGPEPSR